MSKRSPLVASALALAVSSAFAQSTTETTNPLYQLASLDPVVVSASRFEQVLSDVPALMQVISKEQIHESTINSVPEAISKLGNINVRSTQGGALGVLADIDMRGFGASARDNTLILVDGMRVSPIDSGAIRWESIPIGAVERIEIIHGGGSVQYGDKAVGGVINIITRIDPDQVSSASVTLGSYGSVLTNGALISRFGDTRAKIDVAADSTDGWRDNSQTKQSSVKAQIAHQINSTDKLFIEGFYSWQKYHNPGAVVGEVNTGNRKAVKFNNANEKTTSDSLRGVVGLSKSLGNGWQFLAELGYSNSDSTQSRPYYAADASAITAGEIVYDRWSYDFTPRFKKIWNQRNDSVFGLDYQKARAVYTQDTGNKTRATIENKSLYAMHRYFASEQFDISGGARRQIQDADAFDKNDALVTTAAKRQSANAVDLAFRYRFDKEQKNKLFLRSNRSYRFANTDEYWSSSYGPAPDFEISRVFSGILRPQKVDTVEAGGSVTIASSTSLTGTLFQSDSIDEIRYRYSTDSNINAPKIRREGVVVRATQIVNKQFVLQGSMTLQNAKYQEGDYNGKDVPLVPGALISLGATYKTLGSLSYHGSVNYVSDQRYMDDDDNTKSKMPSYVLLDLGLRHVEKNWELEFNVKNATDEKYATYGGYGFVTQMPTSGNSYFYYPGDPRTFWFSARYKFN